MGLRDQLRGGFKIVLQVRLAALEADLIRHGVDDIHVGGVVRDAFDAFAADAVAEQFESGDWGLAQHQDKRRR